MGNASGALFRMLYAREAAWGTRPAGAKHRILPIRSETLEGGAGLLESDELSGNRMFEEPIQGNFNASGDVNVQWSAEAHGYPIHAFLGGVYNPVLQTVAQNPDFNPWAVHSATNQRYKDKAGADTDVEGDALYVGVAPAAAPTTDGSGATLTEQRASATLPDPVLLYRHFIEQLKSSSVDIPTFAIEKGFLNVGTTGAFIPILGCTVNRMTFEAAPGAFITGAVGMLGREEGTVVQVSAVAAADVVTIPHKGLNSFAGSIIAGGTVQAVVTRATLTLENNLAQENVVGSRIVGGRFPGRMRASGSLEAFFADVTLYSRYRAFTTTDLTLSFKDGDAMQVNSVAAATSHGNAGYYRDPEVRFEIPGMKFSGATPRTGGEGPVNLPLEFSAFRDPATNAQVRATMVNTEDDISVNAP